MTETIKVTITDIKVYDLILQFRYTLKRGTKMLAKNKLYDESYTIDKSKMRRLLKEGYATELVLHRHF